MIPTRVARKQLIVAYERQIAKKELALAESTSVDVAKELSSAASYVHSTACPSYADAFSSKLRLDRRGISSIYNPYGMARYPLVNSTQVRVFNMMSQ